MRTSLISKRLDRIDAHRAQCWQPRPRRGDREQHGNRHERHRIERLHAEQEHRDDLPEPGSRGKANDGPERNDASGAAENQPQHARARGAQRDTNAELAHALLDGVGEDAEDPDQRECQRERSECRDDDARGIDAAPLSGSQDRSTFSPAARARSDRFARRPHGLAREAP